eukprot:5403545-Amphidinium_carterae.1
MEPASNLWWVRSHLVLGVGLFFGAKFCASNSPPQLQYSCMAPAGTKNYEENMEKPGHIPSSVNLLNYKCASSTFCSIVDQVQHIGESGQ